MLRSRMPTTLAAMLLLCGCAHVPNQWREDGPSRYEVLASPTGIDLANRVERADLRARDWEAMSVSAHSAGVTHWPIWLEDPFVMKSHGRPEPQRYYIGWEDYVALPYGYARFTANWLLLPVSMVVQPPWLLMESDGELSEQLLGYDHDAIAAAADAEEEPHAPPAEVLPHSESPAIPGHREAR